MDDSDQDFSDLCSRLLKRVKRRAEVKEDGGEPGSSPCKAAPRRKKPKLLRSESTGRTRPPEGASTSGVKEKVLRGMERFRRKSPPRLKEEGLRDSAPPHAQEPMEEPESDEALAQKLQQQLDRESENQDVVEKDDGGLFLCQLCQKDLSAMSPQLRAQHINRCLDESENSAPEPPPPPPPPRPRVPDCPICGRGFKSEKSRSTHLKRCSASMGVSPAELLLALQRQAAESVNVGATDQQQRSEDGRRVDASETRVPVKKKAKRRSPNMDEDTMVALALSRSLLDQEKEREEELEEERHIQAQLANPFSTAALQKKPDAGKSRKRRKGAPAAPPPLLLVQDPQTALNRIQERVSALLLCPRPDTPPSPKLLPSTLPMWVQSAPLWLKSALPGGGPDSVCEFYTPELGAFIQPWVRPEQKALSSEVTPVKQLLTVASGSSDLPENPNSLSQEPSECPSTPACPAPTISPPGSRALQDLVELAEEGMTLTQYGAPDEEPADLPLSGFVPETRRRTRSPASSDGVSKLCRDLAGMVNNPQLGDVQLQVDSGEVYFAHSFMLYARCPLLASLVHDAGFGVQEDGMPAARRVLLGDVPGEAVHSLLRYLYTGLCALSQTLLPHVLQLATRFGLPELQQQCQQYSEDPEGSREEELLAQESNPSPQQSLADSQFLELLRSMWQHEESDGEEFAEAGGTDRGMEVEEEGGGSSDGEIQEERVAEEELDEIYEFAATQRKMETTAFSKTSSEEGEEVNKSFDSKTDEEKPNSEAGQRSACFLEAIGSRHSYGLGEDAAAMATGGTNMHHTQRLNAGARLDTHRGLHAGPDASLDRSYSRLFSDSWGEYVEPSPSSSPCKSAPRRMSSVSEVIDLSISPPPGSGEPSESSLPVPGVSPGEGNAGRPVLSTVPPTSTYPSTLYSTHSQPSPLVPLGRRPSLAPSNPNPGPSSFSCNLRPELSPAVANKPPSDCSPSGHVSKEPELIVLSDGSDDMDPEPPADKVSPRGASSSPPPRVSQSYTQIKDKKTEVSISSTVKNEPEGFRTAPSEVGSVGLLDGSAEVSWLIPATPEVSTRSSSTQTHNGMRRTRLFPEAPSSSSSDPDALTNSKHFDSLEKPPSALLPDQSSSGDCSSSDAPEHSPALRKLKFIKHSQSSPLPGLMPSSSTPLHPAPGPRSPEPLGSPLHPAPGPRSPEPLGSPLHPAPGPRSPEPLGSPLLSDRKFKQRSAAEWEEGGGHAEGDALSRRMAAGKANKNEGLGSVHLGHSRNLLSHPGEEVSPPGDTGHSEMREKQQSGTEEEENGSVNEVEAVDFCGFDEPPIPFDDSWGLGGGGVGDQGPCFSLRLDSSGDPGGPSEHRGQGKKAPPPLVSPAGPTAPDSGRKCGTPLPDPVVWNNWEDDDEDEDGPTVPLSERVNTAAPPKRVAQLKTPVARKKNPVPLVPITPMPGYSDMDTPELKKKLDSYGVRPLPKKQMVLKLKEIHQYTHQLMSSESEEEASPDARPPTRLPQKPPSIQSALPFKQPTAPPPVSPRKLQVEEDDNDVLPLSQESSTSSTAESERSNPELCDSDDDGSDSEGITASQALVREKDKLLAVRAFIQSDAALHGRVLQYQPLSLSDLKARLKAVGIRLGTAKLLDFLDSQCITFTTAKPGHPAPSRRRARAPAAGPGGRGRKRVVKAAA